MGRGIVTDTIFLFLPHGDAGFRWLRHADTGLAGEGEGVPPLDPQSPAVRIVAVAPAEAVTLHWAKLPVRSPAQAIAAARIVVAEASAAPISELHVAVGDDTGDDSGGGERAIGVVALATMQGWMVDLTGVGVDPVAVVPAPMLLPRPEEGYVRADLGGQGVVRGTASGFADEARLTALITGGAVPETLSRDDLMAALAAVAARAPLDLRQGLFAKRRRIGIDWRLVRRLAVMGLTILALTLAIDLVRIARYSFAADAIEAEADVLAREGLPRGETVTDADRQLTERLSRVRGPGIGFSATAAALYRAIEATPGIEVTAIAFEPTGALRATLAADRESVVTDLKRRIEQGGLSVQAGVFQSTGGRVTGEFTVSPK